MGSPHVTREHVALALGPRLGAARLVRESLLA